MSNECVSSNVLRARDAAKKLGVCRATFYAWQNPKHKSYQSSFPDRVELTEGGGAVGWLESELDQWLRSRPRKSRNPSG